MTKEYQHRWQWRPLFDDRNRWVATAEERHDGWHVFVGQRDTGTVASFKAAQALIRKIAGVDRETAGGDGRAPAA
jgi:hypothetical protein